MNQNPGCPPPGVLAQLMQGKLIDPELSALSGHLEECAACQKQAGTLSPPDPLIETLRRDAPVEDRIARDAPRPLIERLKQIPRRHSSMGPDTFELSHDTSVAPDDHAFDFLAPAQEADEIGRLG